MTSNVLPLHFAPSQASSSQNSNVDNFWLDCHNHFKILRTSIKEKTVDHFVSFINFVLLRREYTVLFSIPCLLTVSLSIPLNKFPQVAACSISRQKLVSSPAWQFNRWFQGGEYQKRFLQSVSAQVVACLAVLTLIKDYQQNLEITQ